MAEKDTTTDGRFAEYLKEHPRMMSALAGTLALLAQVGAVAAGNNTTIG
jgi:hypothetical protein